MKKISAGNTFFLKRVFPVIFAVFPVIVLALMLTQHTGKPPPLVALFFPFIFVFIFFVVYRRLLSDLAD